MTAIINTAHETDPSTEVPIRDNIINLSEELAREQAVNSHEEPESSAVPRFLNDAELLGTPSPELDEFLNRPTTFMLGEMWGQRDKRNTQDNQWKATEMPLINWIFGGPGDKNTSAWGLSRHPVGKDKEGACIVLGSSVGKARKAKSMEYMHAIGLDVDSGARLNDVLDTVVSKGLFCLVYTSFNHGKRGLQLKRDEVMRKLQIKTDPDLDQIKMYLREHDKNRYEESFIAGVSIKAAKEQVKDGVVIILDTPPLEKFRLFFPLEEPVQIIDLAATHEGALGVWEDAITGMAVNNLGIHFDTSCTDPSRLFYTARHPKDADDFYCAIVQGKPLRFEDIEPYKKSLYTAKHEKLNAFEMAGNALDSDKPPTALTPSGVSLNDWHRTHKDRFLLANLLEDYCPDRIRTSGGEAAGHVHTECPFEHEHTSEGGTGTMAINCIDSQSEYWTWFCHHDACQGRHKLQFVEEALRQGWFDESMLSDMSFGYLLERPEEEDDAVIEAFIDVSPLTTPAEVDAAFKRHGELDDDIRAALCAGVILGKNKEKAKAKLDDLLGGTKREREKHWKAGEVYLVTVEGLRAIAETKTNAPSKSFKVSLEVSDPLGDTEARKMESLDARFKIVNYRGKVLVIRTIDLEALKAGDQVLEFWTKESLKQFYTHESWPERQGTEVKMVNPVDRWWYNAQRYSRVVFDPSDTPTRNSINLYDKAKRTLTPCGGDAKPITNFIRDIIANGDEVVYNFIILWLAHLVQRPWERPGTALVLYGDGGAGKGTFSHLVRRLVEPYDVGVSRPNHLVGPFAGPALATSLVVASEEAVYAGDPAMADILKGMITQATMMVEAKGIQAIQMGVYFRLIIESNHKATVRIEGNNAERRYLVSHVSGAMIGKAEEFEELYAHIDGPAMQAFMYDLALYDPADAGGWRAVRTAPETAYRKQMFVDTMRRSDKEFLRMLEDGEIVWKDDQQTFRVVLDSDTENRVPAKALDELVKLHSTRYESELRPAAEVWKRLFGEALEKPRPARCMAERRVFEEKDDTSTEKRSDEYVWREAALNTSMYHLPGLATIRAMMKARMGLGDGDVCGDAA